MLGIDEAGRGPVLGPMVYTAAYCPLSEKSALHALGADDSKQLSAEKRDGLRKKIDAAEFLGTRTAILSAEELSFKMLRRRKYNLNLISHDTALQLVHDCIEAGVNVTEVYVDTVGNPEQYARKFRDRFQHLEKVVVAKKADATYRIVGAASIVAKTTRDHQVHGWKFPEELRPGGITFSLETGSGYPSDPKCKAWMEGNVDSIFGYPSLVRFSWGTTRTVLERKAVAVDWYVIFSRPFALLMSPRLPQLAWRLADHNSCCAFEFTGRLRMKRMKARRHLEKRKRCLEETTLQTTT